jgi:hypothetical protein
MRKPRHTLILKVTLHATACQNRAQQRTVSNYCYPNPLSMQLSTKCGLMGRLHRREPLRKALRCKRLGRRTEHSYCNLVKRFARFHKIGRPAGGRG